MISATQSFRRPIAVPFEGAVTWSVAAQFAVKWQWEGEVIQALGSALDLRREAALDTLAPETSVNLLTIRFDGTIEPRESTKISDVKGKLFRVYPGDLVYSKIDVRNGAIGIAPADIENMCVTSEFPVYVPRMEIVEPGYLTLLIKSSMFKDLLNSMISGASGRKRIQPSQLERTLVPIPSLSEQRKIFEEWKIESGELIRIRDEISKLSANFNQELSRVSGLSTKATGNASKVSMISCVDLERWDTYFFRKEFLHLDRQLHEVGAVQLGEIADFVSRPWSASDFPTGKFEYVEISSVSRDEGIHSSRSVDVNEAPSRATKRLRGGDLIISTTRPYLGSLSIVPVEFDGAVCSSAFAVIDGVKNPEFNLLFLEAFLKSPAGIRQLERRMTGGLYPAIVQSELEKILVPRLTSADLARLSDKYADMKKKIASRKADLNRKMVRLVQETDRKILGSYNGEGF